MIRKKKASNEFRKSPMAQATNWERQPIS